MDHQLLINDVSCSQLKNHCIIMAWIIIFSGGWREVDEKLSIKELGPNIQCHNYVPARGFDTVLLTTYRERVISMVD